MAEIELKMPDLATIEAEVKVVKWLVEEGQPVRRGKLLLEVETDKASMEVESVATGTLKKIVAQSGEAIAAGEVIAIIEVEGDSGKSPAGKTSVAETAARPAGPVAGAQATDQKAKQALGPREKPQGMFAKNRQARQSSRGQSQTLPLSAVQRSGGKDDRGNLRRDSDGC